MRVLFRWEALVSPLLSVKGKRDLCSLSHFTQSAQSPCGGTSYFQYTPDLVASSTLHDLLHPGLNERPEVLGRMVASDTAVVLCLCSGLQACSALSRAYGCSRGWLGLAWQGEATLQVTSKIFMLGGKWSCSKVLMFSVRVTFSVKPLCSLTYFRNKIPLLKWLHDFHRCKPCPLKSIVSLRPILPFFLWCFSLSSRSDTQANRHS